MVTPNTRFFVASFWLKVTKLLRQVVCGQCLPLVVAVLTTPQGSRQAVACPSCEGQISKNIEKVRWISRKNPKICNTNQYRELLRIYWVNQQCVASEGKSVELLACSQSYETVNIRLFRSATPSQLLTRHCSSPRRNTATEPTAKRELAASSPTSIKTLDRDA